MSGRNWPSQKQAACGLRSISDDAAKTLAYAVGRSLRAAFSRSSWSSLSTSMGLLR